MESIQPSVVGKEQKQEWEPSSIANMCKYTDGFHCDLQIPFFGTQNQPRETLSSLRAVPGSP